MRQGQCINKLPGDNKKVNVENSSGSCPVADFRVTGDELRCAWAMCRSCSVCFIPTVWQKDRASLETIGHCRSSKSKGNYSKVKLSVCTSWRYRGIGYWRHCSTPSWSRHWMEVKATLIARLLYSTGKRQSPRFGLLSLENKKCPHPARNRNKIPRSLTKYLVTTTRTLNRSASAGL